jgi:hypothetical protein
VRVCIRPIFGWSRGGLGEILEAFFAVLGASCGGLGASWDGLGAVLGGWGANIGDSPNVFH